MVAWDIFRWNLLTFFEIFSCLTIKLSFSQLRQELLKYDAQCTTKCKYPASAHFWDFHSAHSTIAPIQMIKVRCNNCTVTIKLHNLLHFYIFITKKGTHKSEYTNILKRHNAIYFHWKKWEPEMRKYCIWHCSCPACLSGRMHLEIAKLSLQLPLAE